MNVIATGKHFAGHGQPESGTNIGPVNISERTLRETHLLPFEAAVRRANLMSIMPAYHEIDGVPAHDGELLVGIVGGQFVVADTPMPKASTSMAELIKRLKTDPHSPAQYRCNGILRNTPAFAKAFDVKPGDQMYLPPEQQVRIW